MTDERTLQQIIDLLLSGDEIEEPRIDPVQINLRSGMTFVFRDPLKRGVPPEEQSVIKDGIDKGWLVGSFVIEWGYDVVAEKIARFHRWLEINEQNIAACQPDGVHYRGTYSIFSSSDKHGGSYRTVWGFDSFAGMQEFGYKLADRHGVFRRLVTDLTAFIDRDRAAGNSQHILMPAQGSLHLGTLPHAQASDGSDGA